jgi:dipeptidyl aminopeptidase/acylaminoacyl peptidase
MSPDGSRFVAAQPAGGYQRGELCTYEVATGVQIACADLSSLEAGLRIEDITWSPDGSKLALTERAFVLLRDGDLWLMDAATGALTNIADDGYQGNIGPSSSRTPPPTDVTIPVSPAFTPDGTGVTYSRTHFIGGHSAGNDIVTVPLAGGEPQVIVTVTPEEPGVVYFGIRWAPDGSRLYYSVHHLGRDKTGNGIWVVSPDGSDAQRVVGPPDEDSFGPAVLQVANDGEHLLSWDPAYANQFSNRKPVFAIVDTSTGESTPLVPLDPQTPFYAWISWAGFSPDGGSVLTLTNSGRPILDARVRDVGGSVEHQLVLDDETSAGWIGSGIPMTWASNGIAFVTGAGQFGTATALTIEAGAPSPSEPASPTP